MELIGRLRAARASMAVLLASAAAVTLLVALILGLSLLAAAAAGLFALSVASPALRRGPLVAGPSVRARPRRRRRGALTTAAGFASLNLGGAGLIRRLVRPDYVFVVYAENDRDKRLYFPRWLEGALRPLFPSGLIRFGRVWGMMVAGKVTAESFEESPETLEALLARTRAKFPDVSVIALAGRLPSIAAKCGVALEPPFVRGDRGTLCAMIGCAREQARLLGKDPAEVTIAVPGGAGFIGRQLAPELARDFHTVIALDPRFDGRHWDGNVLYTDRAEDVGAAEAVLVLTARGEEMVDLVPHLVPGAVVADDTHPEIPERVRAKMEGAGATVLKAAVGDSRFRILPRIPIFRADDIPGCLLEALVVLERGHSVLDSQREFNAAADELGFKARLSPHISRSAA